MLTSINLKKQTLNVLILAMGCTLGQQTFAHTAVQKNIDVPATGSGVVYNNLVIFHGCRNSKGEDLTPVVAQSVVFPTVNPIIKDGADTVVPNLTVADLLLKSAGGTPWTSLAGFADLIQNNDVFSKQKEKTDSSGNVIGFEGIKGKLDMKLNGLVPFSTKSVFFKPSACIKSVKIKIAAAEICKLKFKSNGPELGSANLWFPNLTAKFATAAYGKDHTPTLTLTNTAAPDASCANGNDKEYSIWASDADIDANMPIKKYWNK